MLLTPIDFVIIVVYLIVMIVIGIACRGRQQDANDFFTSGGTMSGTFGTILVGLSLAATLFSGISFFAYPSLAYTDGAKVLCFALGSILIWPFIRYYFLPRYLGQGFTQPYEVIERQYGVVVRLVCASLFVSLRIGWMAALIYAPTIALIGATGLRHEWFWPIAAIIGVSCSIYTAFGGIRGVIVTDAIQFVLIIGGILFMLIYALIHLLAADVDLLKILNNTGHLSAPSMSLDWQDTLSLWALIVAVPLAKLGNYIGDQMALQRYLATGEVRACIRSFTVNIIGVVLVITLLTFTGLILVVWYQTFPTPDLPEKADLIFPYFIATVLPSGVSGMLLAAILAATMSSMTSGINALAATITLDFRRHLRRADTASEELKFARRISLGIGLIATLCSGLMSSLGSIFDITQTIVGTFLGPLLACMLLSVARVSIHSRVMVVAIIVGSIAGWGVALLTDAGRLWISPTAFFSCLLLAAAGWVIEHFRKSRSFYRVP